MTWQVPGGERHQSTWICETALVVGFVREGREILCGKESLGRK